MKTKTFDKKLVLNKNTIADLDTGEMNDVFGGGTRITVSKCGEETCLPVFCPTAHPLGCPSAPWTNCTNC